MSDNRKILVAKRKIERSYYSNPAQNSRSSKEFDNPRRGTKRTGFCSDAPKKNLANERLKRLRTSINEELQKPSSGQHRAIPSASTSNALYKVNVIRKRPTNESFAPATSVKLPKRHDTGQSRIRASNSNAFVFKQEYLKEKKNFSATTVASSKRSFAETTVSATSAKLPKRHDTGQSRTRTPNSNAFVFKQEYQKEKKVFSATTVASSKRSFAETTVSAQSTEDMDWSSTDDLSVKPNDNSCRVFNINNTSHSTKFKSQFFVVVDTNIFLSHLQLIKDIVTMNIKGEVKPVIFIPWIVIEELDFIKEDTNKTSLKYKAQEAIKYVEKTMASKNDRMMGQTLDEVNQQKNVGKSQDNKIIACCLQVFEKRGNMILLTADINLKNKAHFNNIPVCSHTEIMTKISLSNRTKVQSIMEKMTTLCSVVITKCAEIAYGPACSRMSICQPPPKSLQECISRFTKYWFPVFQEVLMKQFKKSIDDLSAFLIKHQNIGDNSNEVGELLRLCVRVCLFLKDVECCKDAIEYTIRDLNGIKES